MSAQPDTPAFPYKWDYPNGGFEFGHGLTKRELIAALQLAGLAANPEHYGRLEMVDLAVRNADALIARLNGEA